MPFVFTDGDPFYWQKYQANFPHTCFPPGNINGDTPLSNGDQWYCARCKKLWEFGYKDNAGVWRFKGDYWLNGG